MPSDEVFSEVGPEIKLRSLSKKLADTAQINVVAMYYYMHSAASKQKPYVMCPRVKSDAIHIYSP